MPAATAPLLTVQPDWALGVTVTETWVTSVLPARSGQEQRLGFSIRPTESLTYSAVAQSTEETMRLVRDVRRATLQSGYDTRQVRVPWWPDEMVLAVGAAIGESALTVLGDASLRRFVDGGQVAVFTGEGEPTVLTLAAADSVDGSDLYLAEALEADLPPGVRLMPLVAGRLGASVSGQQAGAFGHTLELTVTVDRDLAGMAPETTGPGTDERPVVASIEARDFLGEWLLVLYTGQSTQIRAICRDSTGRVVPQPGPLEWVFTNPSGLRVVIPDPDAPFCNVENEIDGADSTLTITEPISGVSETFLSIIRA